MQRITNTNTLIVVDPIMSPLFTAQLITVSSYNKLTAQTQQDISVVAYSKQAYSNAMSQSYNAQANAYVVYNVTNNLSYNRCVVICITIYNISCIIMHNIKHKTNVHVVCVNACASYVLTNCLLLCKLMTFFKLL